MRNRVVAPAPLAVALLLLSTAALPATALAVASAELSTTQAYFYGRFDARIRFAPGDGIVLAGRTRSQGRFKSR
jgi:Glycosyl hydrolases family 16